MKLNPDCVRDILIEIESETNAFVGFEYEKDGEKPKKLKKYDHNEILYHLSQCSMAGLIVDYQPMDAGDVVFVGDLSPEGHKFLANIREDNIWNGAKAIAAQIGAKSLDAFIQISTGIVTELIRSHFGLA